MRHVAIAAACVIVASAANAADPQMLAEQISKQSFQPGDGFAPVGDIVCAPTNGKANFVIQCHLELTDAQRAIGIAKVDFLIYSADVDFAREDTLLADAIQRLKPDWRLDNRPDISLNGPHGTIEIATSCHQALGRINGIAYCLSLADPQIMVMTSVAPARASTKVLETDTDSATYADVNRAGDLAGMSAIHVKKAL